MDKRNGKLPLWEKLEASARPKIRYWLPAAVHYGKKDRYFFACAEKFGNSYGQDYDDLFWRIKRNLMAVMWRWIKFPLTARGNAMHITHGITGW